MSSNSSTNHLELKPLLLFPLLPGARAMAQKLKTKLSTMFAPPPKKSQKHGEAAANGGSTIPHSPSTLTPARRATVPTPAAAGPPSLSRDEPNLQNSGLSSARSQQAGITISSPGAVASPNTKPGLLPARPQPAHPPLISKISHPLPSKVRHNSYPPPHNTSSPSIGLRPKPPGPFGPRGPTPLTSRTERQAQAKRYVPLTPTMASVTAESQICREDLLNQGIKVRDFQREMDERAAYLRSEAALRRRMEEVARAETEAAADQKVGQERDRNRNSSRCGCHSGDGTVGGEGSDTNGNAEKVVFEGRCAGGAEKSDRGKRLRKPST